jgi:glycosyltransferase involved in cell wall biosynthesis
MRVGLMEKRKEPLVSVVTPFYNTADYLADCVQSVRDQTYSNWEYVLVNNCSTDGSAEIAEEFAAKDPSRIKVVHNIQFLSQVQNYNHAVRQISPMSRYCKLLQADDLMFSECLEKMVRLAESDSSIGVVTSYFLRGNCVRGGPIPHTVEVISGPEACRSHFTRGVAVFGSPTTQLFRADIVRRQDPFYDEKQLHEDVDVIFRILKDWKLGFVHQILSFERTDNPSITSAASPFEPNRLDQFLRAFLYIDQFFTSEESTLYKAAAEKEYLQFLAGKFLQGAGKEFRDYHLRGLSTIGYSIPPLKFSYYLLTELIDIAGNPKRTLSRIIRNLWSKMVLRWH